QPVGETVVLGVEPGDHLRQRARLDLDELVAAGQRAESGRDADGHSHRQKITGWVGFPFPPYRLRMPDPSPFGASLRDRWLRDPSVTYLNHGTVGAPPRAVLDHQRALQDEIERQPARFLLRELADPHAEGLGRTPRMREAAAAVSRFVGLDADDDLVFV